LAGSPKGVYIFPGDRGQKNANKNLGFGANLFCLATKEKPFALLQQKLLQIINNCFFKFLFCISFVGG
jgi:hypothetical protein